jgi:hypothetical protein
MAHEERVAQEPIVRLGTTFDICGKKAAVVGFTKTGVRCRVEGEKREHTIDFAMIETALTQQEAA